MDRDDFRIVHVSDPSCSDTAYRNYYAIEYDHWFWGWKQYGSTTYGSEEIAKEELERILSPKAVTVIE